MIACVVLWWKWVVGKVQFTHFWNMLTPLLNWPTPKLNSPTPYRNLPMPQLNSPTPCRNLPTPGLNSLTPQINSPTHRRNYAHLQLKSLMSRGKYLSMPQWNSYTPNRNLPMSKLNLSMGHKASGCLLYFVPWASVAFLQKAPRQVDISCDAVYLEQEHN